VVAGESGYSSETLMRYDCGDSWRPIVLCVYLCLVKIVLLFCVPSRDRYTTVDTYHQIIYAKLERSNHHIRTGNSIG